MLRCWQDKVFKHKFVVLHNKQGKEAIEMPEPAGLEQTSGFEVFPCSLHGLNSGLSYCCKQRTLSSDHYVKERRMVGGENDLRSLPAI